MYPLSCSYWSPTIYVRLCYSLFIIFVDAPKQPTLAKPDGKVPVTSIALTSRPVATDAIGDPKHALVPFNFPKPAPNTVPPTSASVIRPIKSHSVPELDKNLVSTSSGMPVSSVISLCTQPPLDWIYLPLSIRQYVGMSHVYHRPNPIPPINPPMAAGGTKCLADLLYRRILLKYMRLRNSPAYMAFLIPLWKGPLTRCVFGVLQWLCSLVTWSGSENAENREA